MVLWPRLGAPCVCQSPIVYVCHFLGQVLLLCIYHLFVWSKPFVVVVVVVGGGGGCDCGVFVVIVLVYMDK